jgi:hypothetical protein
MTISSWVDPEYTLYQAFSHSIGGEYGSVREVRGSPGYVDEYVNSQIIGNYFVINPNLMEKAYDPAFTWSPPI